jgi:hypothetical protein
MGRKLEDLLIIKWFCQLTNFLDLLCPLDTVGWADGLLPLSAFRFL